MAVPDTCCLTEPLNSKQLFLSTISTVLINFSEQNMALLSHFESTLSNFNPALCGVLGKRSTTSAITKMAFSGTSPMWRNFIYKVSRIFHVGPTLRWLSKNSRCFSVGHSQLEITGQPGTFRFLWWILGRKDNFLKLHSLFWSNLKYFSSLSAIKPMLLRLLIILLLVSVRSYFNFSLKLSSFLSLNCFSASIR